jgi:hypothetical protein
MMPCYSSRLFFFLLLSRLWLCEIIRASDVRSGITEYHHDKIDCKDNRVPVTKAMHVWAGRLASAVCAAAGGCTDNVTVQGMGFVFPFSLTWRRWYEYGERLLYSVGIMSVLQRREVHMGFGTQPRRRPVQRHFVFLTSGNYMTR